MSAKMGRQSEMYYTWACCTCRQTASLSPMLDLKCPFATCQHMRCDICPWEAHWRSADSYFTFSPPQNHMSQGIRNLSHNQYPYQEIGNGICGNHDGYEASRSFPESHLKGPTESAGEPSSPSSSQDSPESTSLASFGMSSDTEVEIEFSDEEYTAQESSTTYEQHAMKVLESRLLTTLRDHLDLAAIIIPRIRSSFDLLTASDLDFTSVPGNSNEEKTSGSSQKNETKHSSSGGRGRRPHLQIQNRRKRSRSQGDDDDDENPTQKPFKQPRSHGKISFACHWHKLGPIKYSERNFEGCEKFQFCVNLDIKELRRIKDHFIKRHVTSQCGTCRRYFFRKDERITHEEASNCIPNDVLPLREGINNGQWAAIEKVIGKHRNRNITKQDHDIEKWNKVWDIVFDGEPRPPHPFKDSYNTSDPLSATPITHFPQLLNQFRRFIEIDREDEVLRREDSTPELYAHAVERALLEVTRNEVGNLSQLSAENDRMLDIFQPAETISVSEWNPNLRRMDWNPGETTETLAVDEHMSFQPTLDWPDGYEQFAGSSYWSPEPQLPVQNSQSFQHDPQPEDWNTSQLHSQIPSTSTATFATFQQIPDFHARTPSLQRPQLLADWDIRSSNPIVESPTVFAPDVNSFSNALLEPTTVTFYLEISQEQWSHSYFDDAAQNDYEFAAEDGNISTDPWGMI